MRSTPDIAATVVSTATADSSAASRATTRVTPLQLGALAALGIGIAWVFVVNGAVPVDAYTYLAAGERLNAGHLLYALSAGDRNLLPAQHDIVLLYPPAIAVLWRPLAGIGEWTVFAWWAFTILLTVGASVFIVLARPVAGSIAVLLLFPGLAMLTLIGNLNSVLLAAGCLAWALGRDDRWSVAGAIGGFLTALKPIALPLAAWTTLRGRPRGAGLAGVALGAAVGLGIGLLADGVGGYLDWLGIAQQANAAPLTAMSPALIAPWLPRAIFALGTILALALPMRAGFVAAVVTMAIGHSVANPSSIALLVLVALVIDESPGWMPRRLETRAVAP